MSADDQVFLDILSSLPNEIRKYSTEVAEVIDEQVERLAELVRDSLANTPWLPDYARPRPRAPVLPPPVESGDAALAALSLLDRSRAWAWRHKVLVAAAVLLAGGLAYRAHRRRRLRYRTRRAKRSRSGGRLEVVVMAAQPGTPLTKSLALDLEQKGFVVYVVCADADEEAVVHNLHRQDIRPLLVDITDPASAASSIEAFSAYLQTPHAAVPRTRPYRLQLRALLMIPQLDYEVSPIAAIPPSRFADMFNSHLLNPILTVQAFLPLLTEGAMLAQPPPPPSSTTTTTTTTTSGAEPSLAPPTDHHPRPSKPPPPPPKVLVFTPSSLVPGLSPPFHAPQATVCSALAAFTDVLAAELRPLGIPVVHVQLGSLDGSPGGLLGLGGFGFGLAASSPAAARQQAQSRLLLTDSHHHHQHDDATADWSDQSRVAYGGNFATHIRLAARDGTTASFPWHVLWPGLGSPSSMRELHRAVFDAIEAAPPVSFSAGTNPLSGLTKASSSSSSYSLPTTNPPPAHGPTVIRIGLGSGAVTALVARALPRGLVAWMMGIRPVDFRHAAARLHPDPLVRPDDDDEVDPEKALPLRQHPLPATTTMGRGVGGERGRRAQRSDGFASEGTDGGVSPSPFPTPGSGNSTTNSEAEGGVAVCGDGGGRESAEDQIRRRVEREVERERILRAEARRGLVASE